MIRLVEPEELAFKWSLYKPMVDKALEHGVGETTSHLLFVECMNLTGQLWVMEDSEGWVKGVGITRFLQYSNYKQLQVVTLTGKDLLKDIKKYEKCIEHFAKNTGCKNVSVYGRKGWDRILPKEYKLAYHVYIKEV